MKKFFMTCYIFIVHILASVLLKCTNTVLYHLIVLRGKNPNSEPLRSVDNSVRIDDSEIEWVTYDKPKPNIWVEAINCKDWVNYPSHHPVTESRAYQGRMHDALKEKQQLQEQTAQTDEDVKEAV